jgi:hypothetical protein
MANFYDPMDESELSTLRIPKDGKAFVGLYGGGPHGERLNVTSFPDDKMACTEGDPAISVFRYIAPWHVILEVDALKLRSSTIRACWREGRYAHPLSVANVTAFSGEPGIRKSIVDLARIYVPRAHYLWGTAGNIPGQGDGNGPSKVRAASLRDASLDAKTQERDKVLAVQTAVQPLFDGYNTCAGRSNRYKPPPSDTDLATYLTARQADVTANRKDQAAWSGFGPRDLYPRKFFFKNKCDHQVRWGESCIGVPHFDCIGLVNYCYAKHWYQAQFELEIKSFLKPESGARRVTNDSDLMDGDILIKPPDKHIGMLYKRGDDDWRVVQAEETEAGLTDGAKFDPSSWERYRVDAAYLRARKG